MNQNKHRPCCHVRYQSFLLPGSFCNRRSHEFDFWQYYVRSCPTSITPPDGTSPHLCTLSDTNVPFTGCNVTARDGRLPSHLPVFFTGAVLWKGALRLARSTMALLFGERHKHISYRARPSLICPAGSKSPKRSSSRENQLKIVLPEC